MELHTIAIMSDMEGAKFIHHDRLDKSFNPLVEIPRCCVRVLPDEFMGSGASRQELFNCHAVDEYLFLACSVDESDFFILEQTCEIFMVP